MVSRQPSGPKGAGRYAIYGAVAAGGTATVHLGQLLGPAGFSRVVAIKRLHPQFAMDPDFRAMLLDEGRMAARIRHPNVVSTVDVVEEDNELFLVMEFIEGESLSRLLRDARARRQSMPLDIAIAIGADLLRGLHAAHEARDAFGAPLGMVHRDVSPQNVLVGVDGVARVVDFGIAKAAGRSLSTREGQIKGKVPYMAPEQLRGQPVDCRCDLWGAAVVVWEMLTGTRLFKGDSDVVVFGKVLHDKIHGPASVRADVPEALDEVVRRGLDRFPENRYASALEMAIALEATLPRASAARVGAWVDALAATSLAKRAAEIGAIEQDQPTRVLAASGSLAGIPKEPAEPRAARAADRRRGMAVLGASVLIGAVVAFALLRGRGEASSTVAADATVAASAEPAPIPTPSPPPAPSANVEAATTAPAADDSSPASASPVGATSAPPLLAKKGARHPHAAPPPSGDRHCYKLDASGIWHIIPSCL